MTRLPLLTGLCADRRGTSVVELALMMPVAAFLMAGTVTFAIGFAEKLDLERVATRTVQQAVVQGRGVNDYSYLRQSAADAATVPLANVTLDKWLECNGARQSAAIEVCTAPAAPARFISITITKSYTPTFNLDRFQAMFSSTVPTPTSVRGSARMRVG